MFFTKFVINTICDSVNFQSNFAVILKLIFFLCKIILPKIFKIYHLECSHWSDLMSSLELRYRRNTSTIKSVIREQYLCFFISILFFISFYLSTQEVCSYPFSSADPLYIYNRKCFLIIVLSHFPFSLLFRPSKVASNAPALNQFLSKS